MCAEMSDETALRGIANHGDGSWFSAVPGETMQIRIRSGEVDGRFTIIESLVQPGVAVPLHRHREDEIFHVLEGVVTFDLDGRRLEGRPGTIVVAPANLPHRWANFGPGPARLMATLTPGGLEGFFEELSAAGFDALPEIVARYGTVVLGPPLER
jgi:quercetin dioxygenase-like cupin family protein